MNRLSHTFALAGALAAGLLATAAPAQNRYQVTDLDGNGILSLGAAFRISESGTAAGLGNPLIGSDTRGVLWTNRVSTLLPPLPNEEVSEAYDVSETGVAGGTSFDVTQVGMLTIAVPHAVIWQNGQMTDLHDPTVIFGRTSTARAINERGVIVGSADFVANGLDYETATIWDHGTITSLGTLAGNQSYARDINDHGTVVGTTTFTGNGVHAFIYRGGVMQDLNDLIPAGSGWVLSNAHAITNDGRIVGEGFNNGLRPFLLEPDGCGRFTVYGAGCPASGGFTPALWGAGCATGEGLVSFAITGGPGGAHGAVLFGSGQGTGTVLPGCDLEILPLFPVTLPVRLDGSGPGEGTWQTEFSLAPGTPPLSLFLQSAFVDPSGLSLSNALRMDTQ